MTDWQLADRSVVCCDIDWNQSLYIHEIGSRDSDGRALQRQFCQLAEQNAYAKTGL